MGLFSWRKNKNKDDGSSDLTEFEGMRFEVMDEREHLLFSARAGVTWDGALELRPTIVPRFPPGASYIPVLLRGYEPSVKKAIHMEGNIVPLGDGRLQVEDLKLTGKDNDRAFYRQATAIVGSVMPLRQRGVEALPCRVLNVSAGGVCLQVRAECMVGEKLLLRSSLLDGWKEMALMCVVRRATRRKNAFEYGCEFVDLSPALEEAISRAILEMQLQQRAQSR